MTSTELKHQTQLTRWVELIKECRGSGRSVKAGVSNRALRQLHIITGNARCWRRLKWISVRILRSLQKCRCRSR